MQSGNLVSSTSKSLTAVLNYDLNPYRARSTAQVRALLELKGGEINIPEKKVTIKGRYPTLEEVKDMVESIHANAGSIFDWCVRTTHLPDVDIEILSHPFALRGVERCCGRRPRCLLSRNRLCPFTCERDSEAGDVACSCELPGFKRPLLAVIFVVAYPLHVLLIIFLIPVFFAYNFNSTVTGLIGLATAVVNALSFTGDAGLVTASNVLGVISGIFVILAKYELQTDAIFSPRYTAYKVYLPLVGRSYSPKTKVLVCPFRKKVSRTNVIVKANQLAIRYTSDFIAMMTVLMTKNYYINEVASSNLMIIVLQLSAAINQVELTEEMKSTSAAHRKALEVIEEYRSLVYYVRDKNSFKDFCYKMCFKREEPSEILALAQQGGDFPPFFEYPFVDSDPRRKVLEKSSRATRGDPAEAEAAAAEAEEPMTTV